MDNIYDQILDKVICTINRPNLKKKINREIIDPIIKNIYQRTHNYLMIIVSLYGITILLLLIILSIIISKKNYN
jgi:hypothetical protein